MHLLELLSGDDGVQGSSNSIPHKVIVHVGTFVGNSIYKPTLVSHLKGDPSSSKDRPTRMNILATRRIVLLLHHPIRPCCLVWDLMLVFISRSVGV